MAMMEKMKEKLPGVKGKAEAPDMMEKKKAMPGIEIEIESEGEAEDSLSEASAEEESEADEEEVTVGELAKLSDEELLAEVKKRGLSAEAPEAPEEPAKA